MSSRLQIRNGRVIKRYAREELDAARDKYALLSEAGKSADILLVTPIDEEQGGDALAFPELTGLQPIRSVLFGSAGSDAASRAIDLCAKGLALIHAVRLDHRAARSVTIWSHPQVAPDDVDGSAVLLHGDFGLSNLFFVRGGESGAAGRLVVIDAEANGYFTWRHLEVGSRYVDLALMASCLLGRLGACRSLLVDRRTCGGYIRSLAARYERHSGFKVSLPRLRHYTSVCVRSYFARRFANPLLARLASEVLLRRFHPTPGGHSS